HPAQTVVITGGEPLIYNLDYLTSQLQNAGIKTFIETSGAYPLSGHWDWICLSPKKLKARRKDVLDAAGELKVIVFNKSDFAWVEEQVSKFGLDCKLYLQPEWSKAAYMTPLIIDYVKNNPKWEISLHTHKCINIP